MGHNKELLQILAECAAACENCMDACLDEQDLKKMVGCIRLDRDCSKICHATASFMASNSKHAKHLIKECEEICRQCADECGQHEAAHCKKCAQACRECAEACSSYSGVAA